MPSIECKNKSELKNIYSLCQAMHHENMNIIPSKMQMLVFNNILYYLSNKWNNKVEQKNLK